jgi:hypothetical protein
MMQVLFKQLSERIPPIPFFYFAPSSETPDLAPSSQTQEPISGDPEASSETCLPVDLVVAGALARFRRFLNFWFRNIIKSTIANSMPYCCFHILNPVRMFVYAGQHGCPVIARSLALTGKHPLGSVRSQSIEHCPAEPQGLSPCVTPLQLDQSHLGTGCACLYVHLRSA